MRANIRFEKRKFSDLAQGSIFIGQFEQEMCYAFLFSYQSGESGVLVLEGRQAGQAVAPVSDSVLCFIDEPVIVVSQSSGNWSPSRPVSSGVPLCLTDKGLHFAATVDNHKAVINIENGEIHDVPYRALYASRWALQLPGEREPQVMRE